MVECLGTGMLPTLPPALSHMLAASGDDPKATTEVRTRRVDGHIHGQISSQHSMPHGGETRFAMPTLVSRSLQVNFRKVRQPERGSY